MRRALTTLAAAALGCSALAAALPAVSSAAPRSAPPRPPPPAAAAANPVVQWNRFLLGLQATPGAQPATVHPTYELAIDAHGDLRRRRGHRPLGDAVPAARARAHGASRDAAADAAAHDTLVRALPRAARADRRSSTRRRWRQVPRRRRARPAASRVGRAAAAPDPARAARERRLERHAARRSRPALRPGDYQLTPPAFAAPVFTHWPQVHAVRRCAARTSSGRRRRRRSTSPKYAAALDEVRALGAATGSTRTADQTQIGLFWNPPIWATWNRIAQDRGARPPRDARPTRAHVRRART